VVSEYGSRTADRPGKYDPGWSDLAKNEDWRGVEWRSGQSIWCGFDHGSIAGSTLGKMRLVDYFRIPKRAYYWYRNYLTKVAPPAWPVDKEPARLRLTASKTKDIKTDGTDDTWRYIEVLDAEGNVVTACPDVTLTIVRGPGELPTGRSIQFSRNSDIRILDGQAAISLRAYETGTTVVEASADGLTSSKIELNFVGEVPYVEGKTPVVAPRPYKHYVRQKREEQKFGVNNPTFASSQTASHPAGAAADGNEKTWWASADDDTSPYLMLDTEKGLKLNTVELTFPTEKVWRFCLEGSIDGKQWITLDNLWNNQTPFAKWTYKASAKAQSTIRFIRVKYSDTTQAALSEIDVRGIVSD
jgi:beta-galactosidase